MIYEAEEADDSNMIQKEILFPAETVKRKVSYIDSSNSKGKIEFRFPIRVAGDYNFSIICLSDGQKNTTKIYRDSISDPLWVRVDNGWPGQQEVSLVNKELTWTMTFSEDEIGIHSIIVETEHEYGYAFNDYFYFDQLIVHDVISDEITKIVSRPFSSDFAYNYNSGNTRVIYPTVDVINTDKNGNNVNGFTRFHFYTWNDKLPGGKKLISDTITNAGSLKIRHIEDRSSMVCALKKVEKYNKDSLLVYERIPEYAFSDQLSDDNSVHEKPGVLFNSLDSRIPSNKPLGLIRERSKMVTGDDYHISSVMDVIKYTPYITGVTEKTNEIKVTVKNGLFNALTGEPMVSITRNHAEPDSEMIEMKIPASFVYKSTNDSLYQDLMDANNYRREGVSLSLRKKGLNTAYLNADGLPMNLLRPLVEHNFDPDRNIILQATVETHKNFGSTFQILPRYILAWKGGQFSFPDRNNPDRSLWQRGGEIIKADVYSRVLTTKDEMGIDQTSIWSPFDDILIGKVNNAKYDECGVFTCDYMYTSLYQKDSTTECEIDASKYDVVNGWERGKSNSDSGRGAISEITNDESPFGLKCVYVKNAYGPTKNLKFIKTSLTF